PRYEELETILKGKPEVDIGTVQKPPEPPDWVQLTEKSAEFLRQTKHLRAGVILSCSLLQTGGFAGFRDGVQFIRGLLERYWPILYPLLDAEDNNDPTQRLNILSALTAPRGSVDSWLSILEYLYTAPLCRPKGGAPVTFDDIQAAKRRRDGAEGAPSNAPDPARIGAAIRDAGSAQPAAHHQALQQTLEAIQGIDQFLTTTLGVGNTISFETLEKTLQEMLAALEPYLPSAVGEHDTPSTPK